MFKTASTTSRAAIAFIMVTAIIDIMAMVGIIIPVLPKLILEFTGSEAQAGWINGLFVALWAAFQFLFSPIIGSLSDQRSATGHFALCRWLDRGLCADGCRAKSLVVGAWTHHRG